MARTKYSSQLKLPDAINCSIHSDFTQIPNTLLRNSEISSKAKIILAILLSNREGWKSCMVSLQDMMREGKDAIFNGLAELENEGYLIRVRFRDKITKSWKGSFWAYTDTPGNFWMEDHIKIIHQQGYEPVIIKKPHPENPYPGNPVLGNPLLIILKEKKIEEKEGVDGSTMLGYIASNMFEKFWKIYPRKDSKGSALTKWNTICKKGNKRPTWVQIKQAIIDQKKSERWSDPQFIPLSSTWLNQSRWLDDPKELKKFSRRTDKPKTIIDDGIEYKLRADGYYYTRKGTLYIP